MTGGKVDNEGARSTAAANATYYDSFADSEVAHGSPHFKHAAVGRVYRALIKEAYDGGGAPGGAAPRVLDLGGGDGFATLEFLRLGARVATVDISARQLDRLRQAAGEAGSRLEVHCVDVFEALRSARSCGELYDIVIASSFLHHVPDYLDLITRCTEVLAPRGQFLSFQDPIRYDSLGALEHGFSRLAYLSWRAWRGDLIGGIQRTLRRRRGIYVEAPEDEVEYHMLRNGVDQDAIRNLLEGLGFDCRVLRLFATQSRIWQAAGWKFGMANTFAVIARRRR